MHPIVSRTLSPLGLASLLCVAVAVPAAPGHADPFNPVAATARVMMTVDGHRAYVVRPISYDPPRTRSGDRESATCRLSVFDVDGDAEPVLAGDFALDGDCKGFTVADGLVYAAMQDRLAIYDTSLPDRIIESAVLALPGGAATATIHGDRCYVLTENRRLVVVDVSRPLMPSLIATEDLTGDAIAAGDGKVYISDDRRITVFFGSRLSRRTPLAAFAVRASSMAAGDGCLAVLTKRTPADQSGWEFKTLGVTGEGDTYEADTITSAAGWPVGLVVDSGRAYVVEYMGMGVRYLNVFGIDDPETIRERARVELPRHEHVRIRNTPATLAVCAMDGGKRLLVLTNWLTDACCFDIIDVADAEAPQVAYTDKEPRLTPSSFGD